MDEDRRHFSRVEFSSNVFVKVNGHYFETDLIDISLKGALIRFENQNTGLKKGNPCIFELRLDGADTVLRINSVVVYEKEYQYGLKFGNIDLESMIHLRRLIELNIGDPDKIQQELFFMVNQQ